MSIQQHKDYNYEKARLKYTKKYVEHLINTIIKESKVNKENIKQAMVDLDYLDSSQSYITILTSNELLRMGAQKYSGLIRSQNKPYFGRVDFKESGSNQPKRYYLGKVALARPKDNKPILIDWRSPLANIYYDGRLGEVSYESPSGTVKGELSLKRQYTINEGKLEDFIDIDITTTDTFLQASLQANADNRLKDIASTIQSEQNKIIRADSSRPLLVQGVAGSGKTTIALHRIAYLMYTYEDKLTPENFLVLAPNRLFINYISEVLPELGVERTRQSTFTDFIIDLIGVKYHLTSTNDKIQDFLDETIDIKEKEILRQISKYKGSLDFKSLIDNYVKELEQQLLPDEDFALADHILFAKEDMKELFIIQYSYLALYRRFALLKKVLANKLKNAKENILKEIEGSYEKQIESARSTIPDEEERRSTVIRLIDEREEKLEKIKKISKTLVTKYLAKVRKSDLIGYYKELLSSPDIFMKYSEKPLEEEFATYFCKHSSELLKKKRLEYEDLAALAYLEYKIFDAGEKNEIQHVIIDEAQDFSLFQFYILKQILNTKLFTILGDLSQGIHAYRSIDNWQQVIEHIFTQDECQFLTLEQSYRTTVEVMSLANEIIKNLADKGLTIAKPVIRHGVKPQILKTEKENKIISMIKKVIDESGNEEYKSFAVICKSPEECEIVHRQLEKAGIEATLIKGEEAAYTAEVIVLPSYIAKGLEFDVVFIVSMKAHYKMDDLDTKLLYVAMTRALHMLYVGYIKGAIPLLDEIDESLFEKYVLYFD